jgi:hypothetical protein
LGSSNFSRCRGHETNNSRGIELRLNKQFTHYILQKYCKLSIADLPSTAKEHFLLVVFEKLSINEILKKENYDAIARIPTGRRNCDAGRWAGNMYVFCVHLKLPNENPLKLHVKGNRNPEKWDRQFAALWRPAIDTLTARTFVRVCFLTPWLYKRECIKFIFAL